MHRKLFIDGQWVAGDSVGEVTNKYTGKVIATVETATADHVDRAVTAAEKAADTIARLPAHKRGEILQRTSALLEQKREEIAKTIAAEAGKALKFSRAEVDRAVSTFAIAAEEAKRIHGETVPLDAVPAGVGYLGFWMRRPIGVVGAITPFNFPLNLVAHKVAPAIAAGNSVVLKPAEVTPLASFMLAEILHEAGLPPGGINVVHGPGRVIGAALVSDPRVPKLTFTGSAEVGREIISRAGIKKVTLELGNSAPVIVAPDADLDFVAKRCALGAYYYSGQVCISVQRVFADKSIQDEFTERFTKATQAMVVGDPLDERVDVGPMISEKEALRIERWVGEAKQGGAQVLTGDRREGPVYWPTLVTKVQPEMKLMAEEAFGPVASLVEYDEFEQALAMADNTQYGLQAAVFTRDIDRALLAVRRLNFGGVVINDMPAFRADHMPYGGNRQSGLGREGLKFAIEEMTNIQMVAIRSDAMS